MDFRRKRLVFRAAHRGTKESDLIFGAFFAEAAAGLTDSQVDEAEAMLEENDIDLVYWVTGLEPVPERWQGTILDDVISFFARRHA